MSLVHNNKEAPSWIQYIWRRIENNKNFLCFISGPTGSGKSYCSLKIGELLDPDFTEERIVFNAIELMNLINSGELKAGSVIVFEEAGVELNNRNWQSKVNRVINFLTQTFRHKNLIVIFNAPYSDFVDSATMKLFHAEFQTIKIDKKKKEVKLKPLVIQYNGRTKKFYYKFLKVTKPKQKAVSLERWSVGKPSPELIKLYEARKTKFTEKLNKKIVQELEEFNKKDRPRALTLIQKEILDCLIDKKTIPQISEIRKAQPTYINKQVNYIRAKGYTITPIKEGNRVTHYDIEAP